MTSKEGDECLRHGCHRQPENDEDARELRNKRQRHFLNGRQRLKQTNR